MQVTTSHIPRGDDVVFPESGIFRRHDPSSGFSLPSPAAVRAEGARQHGAAAAARSTRPPPVRFPSLGLLVKYGSMVSVAEAQCLVMVRQFLPTIPVPEVYGWRHDGRQAFIYMELVEGATLEESWDGLTEDEKTAICGELHDLVATWRRLPQTLFSDTPFIGSVVGEPLLDSVFVNTGSVGHGPFPSVSQFHDWFTTAYGPHRLPPWEPRSPHPYRCYLPDDGPIVFTHADLHPTNILIRASRQNGGSPRVAAVIDWQQAGWYPAYWEYCKSRWAWSAKAGSAWPETYVPKVLEAGPYEGDCYNYWDYFVLARGI
ncbi:Protein kinase-like domain protein [Niveomyces insectorum RCEF 264]|uniref:Protein kinase-like domain protein n=1 Tax=Niveomyces insectorum RCEF 264 TaxID=1081102 RepID=A0A162MFX7_9HYPO|nr:Protein kinase-like domain protein [Niveomyces insectorum RCEF 264]